MTTTTLQSTTTEITSAAVAIENFEYYVVSKMNGVFGCIEGKRLAGQTIGEMFDLTGLAHRARTVLVEMDDAGHAISRALCDVALFGDDDSVAQLSTADLAFANHRAAQAAVIGTTRMLAVALMALRPLMDPEYGNAVSDFHARVTSTEALWF